MIKYNSINGLPVDEKGNIVECQFSLVQGEYVLVFESNDELMAYIKPDTSFVKRGEKEQQAEGLFDVALEENWYSRFDVMLYAQQGEQKAIDLLAYYDSLWRLIESNFNQGIYEFELPHFGGK